jgi:hypothetical protein
MNDRQGYLSSRYETATVDRCYLVTEYMTNRRNQPWHWGPIQHRAEMPLSSVVIRYHCQLHRSVLFGHR